MNRLIPILLLVTLFFAQNDPENEFVLVQITDADLEQLGPWPIDRKWFAILIEQAMEENSPAVFIDIAFQTADSFHPKSDRFFYHVLERYPVYLRAHQDLNDIDSLTLLGDLKLPVKRFWGLFANQFRFEAGFIYLNNQSGKTLISILKKDAKNDYYFSYPDKKFETYSLTEILQNSKLLYNKTVVVGLDSKGLSSYIQIPNRNQLVTGTEIELHSLIHILNNNPYIYINQLYLLIPLLPIGIVLYRQRNKRNNLRLNLVTISLHFIIALAFIFLNVYLSDYVVISYTLILVGFLIYSLYENTVQNRINLRLISESAGPEHGMIHAEIERLKEQLRYYEEKTDRTSKSELIEENGILYTANSPMKKLMHRANEVALSDLNVLITGPTGTGKELLAKHIHLKSNRVDKPFIVIHCGALTETLIESELFGHEKGAFTGADQEKIGRFKLADGGSIFLDEIAETSPAFQVKLLRVIQEGTFERVGGNETHHVNVRVIAATHRDIKTAINESQFRDDLYYRLAGYELKLPALNERPMDIQPLFLSILNQVTGNEDIQISEALFNWLSQQEWGGNIRQLKMLTERAVVNARSSNRNQLVPADFEMDEQNKVNDTDQTAVLVIDQLRKHQFKHRAISLTAQDLNLHRITVTEYLRGTIIQQFIRSNYSKDILLKRIADDSIIENNEQFEKRIIGYLETMTKHIKTAISDKMGREEIRQRHFTNLPAVFINDLFDLIDYSKERI